MVAVFPHHELVACGSSGMEELLSYLRNHPAHSVAILLKTKENAETLSRIAPYTEAYPVPESGVQWYLCTNGACAMPVERFEQLHLK